MNHSLRGMSCVHRSVSNALAVLDLSASSARRSGLPSSLVRSSRARAPCTGCSRHWRRAATSAGILTPFKAFGVGSLVAGRGAIREIAAPFPRALMPDTQETVHLGVLDEWVGRLHRGSTSLYGAREIARGAGSRGLDRFLALRARRRGARARARVRRGAAARPAAEWWHRSGSPVRRWDSRGPPAATGLTGPRVGGGGLPHSGRRSDRGEGAAELTPARARPFAPGL